MGKKNKKNKSRSVVRISNKASNKKKISKRAQERAREKELSRIKRQEELQRAREDYLIIKSDSERPEAKKSVIVKKVAKKAPEVQLDEQLKENLKRISLSEIQRYAKTSAAAYDKAFNDIELFRGKAEELDKEIAKLKASKNATDEEKAALAERRKALRKDKAELEKHILIARANAEALERSSDEYAYIVTLLTGSECSLKKKPRLNDKKIDLTREEEEELVERYLQSKRPKAAKASAEKNAEPSEEISEEVVDDVKTLKVLGSEDKENEPLNEIKKENSMPESKKGNNNIRKWIIWPIIAVIAVAAVVGFRFIGKSGGSESAPAASAPVAIEEAANTQQEAKIEEPAAEVKAEPSSVEPVSVDSESVDAEADNAFRREISIDGIDLGLEIEDSRATISYPSSIVTENYIVDFFSILADKYPDYLSTARYSIENDRIVVETPFVLGAEDKEQVADLFEAELGEYIASLSAPLSYKDSYSFYDSELNVEVRRNGATVSYPEYITEDDVLGFISYAVSKYPEVKDFVSYSISSGKAEFSLPFDLTDEEMRAVSDILGDEIINYLALIFEGDENGSEEISIPSAEPADISPADVTIQKSNDDNTELKASAPVEEEKKEAVAVVPASPVEESSNTAALNSYKTKAFLMASASFMLGKDQTIGSAAVYQNYALGFDFENILKAGRNFGFGVRAELSMDAIPYEGDYSKISSASAFFDYQNWMRMYMLSADAMMKYNGGRYGVYAGFGFGYALANPQLGPYQTAFGYTLGDISTTLSSAWAITALAGAEFNITEKLSIATEINYKHLLPASKGYLSGGVAMGLSF